jgi:NAD(P)-dependent dehydrogenase (short-subunit alcohol dehydrogenase family)
MYSTEQGTVIACCRSPSTANDLNDYIHSINDDDNNRRRIQTVLLDLEDQASIECAANTIQNQFDRIDILFNVAGLLGDGGKSTPGPERSITKIDRTWLDKTLAVNVIGPVMLIKELSPLLTQRQRLSRPTQQQTNSDQTKLVGEGIASSTIRHRQPSVVVNFSARVGSISDNALGGWYSYRISKAALNQATRTIALELKRSHVWAISFHPGTTDTDLSKPFQGNVKEGSLFPVEFTVNQVLNVVDAIDEKHTGGFYDWAGQAISF